MRPAEQLKPQAYFMSRPDRSLALNWRDTYSYARMMWSSESSSNVAHSHTI